MISTSGDDARALSRGLTIHAAVLAVVMAAFHVVVATVGGGVVDQWAMLVLAIAAVAILVAALTMRRMLIRRPFAFFAFHVISYVLVVGSVSVHAFLAAWTTPVGGGLVWMVSLWSIGLLVHTFASVARGGFADADA